VGLPLFIGGVAVTSLVVHASVMTHTAWVSNFWNGGAAKTAAVDTNIAPVASNVMKTADGYVITVNVTPGASSLDGAELAAKLVAGSFRKGRQRQRVRCVGPRGLLSSRTIISFPLAPARERSDVATGRIVGP
jgi:hypothetical protein